MPSMNAPHGDPAVPAPSREEREPKDPAPARPEGPTSPRFWRSLEELEDTPEFREMLQREFPNRKPDEIGPLTRRRFLQLMGASIALAGTTGCWRAEKILPFTSRPEDWVPGSALRYATGMDLGGHAVGLLVTSHDGRPTKIEGNPKHPSSLGASSRHAQASILELYDPDRSHEVLRGGEKLEPATFEEFSREMDALRGELRERRGKGVAVLSEASSSPTVRSLEQRLLERFPSARWFEYEPWSRDNEREGSRRAFGKPKRAIHDFGRARVVVSLDADPFFEHPRAVRHARDFALARRPEESEPARVYAVEASYSRTGGMADHRLPLQSSEIPAFTAALGHELAKRGGEGAERFGGAAPSFADAHAREVFDAIVEDLDTHRGASIVVAGPGQPPEVHEAVHALNALLGNSGTTIGYVDDAEPDRPSHLEAIRELTAAMEKGEVETLLIFGGNPVYDAPADLGFEEALRGVARSIHVGLYADETAAASRWHVPRAHYLESWNDGVSWDGTYTVCQPLIRPLYAGKTPAEILATLLGEGSTAGYELVRETFRRRFPGEKLASRFERAIHDGLVEGSAPSPASAALTGSGPLLAGARSRSIGAPATDLEVRFEIDPRVHDGRFANNGWLQELPDYITKITWDNAVLVAPATAKRLGISTNDVVTVSAGGTKIRIATYVLPGHAPDSVTLLLGYGRERAGRIGGFAGLAKTVSVGVDVYPLRRTDGMFATTGSIGKTGEKHTLATTQEHHLIDSVGERGRDSRVDRLIRQATYTEFEKHPDFAKHRVHHPPLKSLWKEFEYHDRKWGMTIDLDRCNGCDACVVACQAENNIPIVGRDQVLVGREMHWIRVDRYFEGDPDDPRTAGQPIPCQQCENAPCEQVCPVAATVHSSEGLNDMVYNRCVGTRYCANNCPYKVRRFNFLNYHKNLKDPSSESVKMAFNPDVTVRSRGVMEKCTFCVQRIQNVKIEAKNEGREIRDGEIVPACAQACPSQAIVFGDLNDESSQVAKLASIDRSYHILAELNVKPRVSYLAKIRNPSLRLAPTGEAHESHSSH